MIGTTISTRSGWQRPLHPEQGKLGIATTDQLQQAGPALPDVALQRRAVPKAGRRWPALRVDPLGIVGVLLLIVLWQLLTFLVPVASLPAPWDVVERVGADFWAAPELSF